MMDAPPADTEDGSMNSSLSIVMRSVLTIALLAAVAAGCGGHAQPKAQRAAAAPVITGAGKLVAIGGGRSLYLECVGSGSPTVVLEAGFGGGAGDWRDVQPQIGRMTRTCAYDRAGLGSSVARPGVHDAGDEIDDLQRLLDAADIRAPYVLVGHSYGGLLVRLFAKAHPGETAGVVLVDAMGRDATRRQLAIWPKSQAPARRRQWAQTVIDGVDLRSSEALAGRVRSLGDTPLVVVTAGRRLEGNADLPPRLLQAGERLWGTLQAELAGLSSDHAHVVALRSDHVVQRLDGQPGVVIRAVHAVVRTARDHAQLPPCRQLFRGSRIRCRS
jgi:pimeloyl-ACP methyl ester carboxylesterase